MKTIFTFLFCCLYTLSFAQIQSNATGATADFGTLNNPSGIGTWGTYGSGTIYSDSGTISTIGVQMTESEDAFVLQGDNLPVNPNHPHPHVGFGQLIRPVAPINMSNPANMLMKVRLRSTGSAHPLGIAVKVIDTAGRTNICFADTPEDYCHIFITPTSEYQDYYMNLQGKWLDQVISSAGLRVDSSAIRGYDFFIDLGPGITNLSQIRIEIDYIQLGSDVDWPHNNIKGRLFNDLNSDCIFNGSDFPIANGLVKATPGPWYALSDSNGYYTLSVDTAVKNVQIKHLRSENQQSLLMEVCPAGDIYPVALNLNIPEYCCYDFAEKSFITPNLNVDIASNRRRRCFRNLTTVNYYNDGNITATATEIKVVYPQYVVPITSSPSWTRQEGNILYYTIGDLPTNERGVIQIIDSVICGNEEIRFLTQCTKAYISANNIVLREDPSWDHSDVQVSDSCKNGIAKFRIANAGNGGMNDSLQYRVFLNDTLISARKFKLNVSQSFNVEVPAGLNTIRLESEQAPYHPVANFPSSTIEGCVSENENLSNAVRGLVNTVPQDDRDEKVSISCMPIADSYDPNDKQSTPVGKTAQHYILQGTDITYKIRFENTGSDTAYTVVVIDTLDANLDVSTLKFGASSHPYRTETNTVDGQLICRFRFNNINLTAKSEDSVKSQGFVQFSIKALESLSDGELINNEAGIYFDYNSPIITNTIMHTIGDYVETDFTRAGIVSQGRVETHIVKNVESFVAKLYPNPTKGEFIIELGKEFGEADLLLYSSSNQIALRQKLKTGEMNKCSIQSLNEGIYYYQIITTEGRIASGKVVKQ